MNNTGRHPHGTIKTDAARDMTAYDACPPPVRRALQDAPWTMSAEYALSCDPNAFLDEYRADVGAYTPIQRRTARCRV